MEKISNDVAKNIKGGISEGAVLLITAAVVFVLGIFTGYTNPLECNNK